MVEGSIQRKLWSGSAVWGFSFSGDAQAGAGDRFAVLVVQVGCYGLDGFAVQSGAGESWAASLYCSTRVSKTLILMCVPLFKSLGEWSDVRTGVPDGMSIHLLCTVCKME